MTTARSDKEHKTLHRMSRRKFIKYSLEAGVSFGIVGSFHAFSREAEYVRPPGSLKSVEFTARCMRCSICVEVCPTNAIRLLDLGWDFKNISTPVIDPAFGGCSHWQASCLKCTDSCPTGALDRGLITDNYKLAEVRFDEKYCVNCMVCLDRCPIEGAILFPNPDGKPFRKTREIPARLRLVNSPLKPYINPDKCTGCGLCAHYCPQKIMFLDPLNKK